MYLSPINRASVTPHCCLQAHITTARWVHASLAGLGARRAPATGATPARRDGEARVAPASRTSRTDVRLVS